MMWRCLDWAPRRDVKLFPQKVLWLVAAPPQPELNTPHSNERENLHHLPLPRSSTLSDLCPGVASKHLRQPVEHAEGTLWRQSWVAGLYYSYSTPTRSKFKVKLHGRGTAEMVIHRLSGEGVAALHISQSRKS